MKKLNILKTIVDILWILSMFSVPLILFMSVFIFISDDISIFNIKINGLEIVETSLISKFILSAMLLVYILLIYCIYLFKSILRSFQRLKIFDEIVIENFNKIGYLLIISAIASGALSFIYDFLYSKEIHLEIGFNSNLLMLCLGFFFIILSETFKMSKKLKEENELTI
ncbi:DUF2975 domain-containing protein [Lutibacter sp. A64]|uniref:DUF2975 domain-containing protein n=1 Tax=Lutibacter sp. A64 TaxID=2918526 RepID=UPI001F062463|nr:DUF2975 domain-containing protein [Lutibacter sp. A64]UMB52784.1 DUF2975 domain-containing protein [Lutibacter sp. A64]